MKVLNGCVQRRWGAFLRLPFDIQVGSQLMCHPESADLARLGSPEQTGLLRLVILDVQFVQVTVESRVVVARGANECVEATTIEPFANVEQQSQRKVVNGSHVA
jgi:hypothetical protein